jgi:hypothetical protein
MFRAILCLSLEGQIVLLQHLVSSLCVSGRTVHRLKADSVLCSSSGGQIVLYCYSGLSPLSTGVVYGLLHRVTIPDAVTIQFGLLWMSIVLLETCREL